MYVVEVRDHIMIAHSLPGEAFGPAQRLHGATFVVDVALFRSELTDNDFVVDIGLATETLKDVLAPLAYANLDELDLFGGKRTTVEVLSRYIFDRYAEAIAAGKLGEDGRGLERLRVTLNESHIARGWYEAELRLG